MKNSKMRLFSVVFASVLAAASLTACSKDSSDEKHESANGIETIDDGTIREDLTALEVVDLMGNGINLGNTMEAYGHATTGVTADVSTYETLWGAPVTTQEMITGMKDAGFDSLRIPIAWTNMMDYESGNYEINEAYLDRVEEIINYAFNEKMYVIINDHWDGSWWGMFGDEDQAVRDQAMEMYKSMWTQIATRYAEYSDYLIFESANEELGFRLNDDWASNGSNDSTGVLTDEECYEEVNKINQAFVDTVRATGGNNENRFLLIAGFGTDITNTCNDLYVMPTDTAKSKLIVSVHYYDPSGYCIQDSLPTWGSKQNYQSMSDSLAKMTKFTDQGYGVIIGEWGVLIEGKTELKENTLEYYENFLDNCDYYGYAPMLWDCWSIFNREEGKIGYDDVATIIKAHSLASQGEKSAEDIKAAAKTDIDAAIAAAEEAPGVADDESIAWLMYNSSDWGVMYSAGDKYDPTSMTEGVVATDTEITGEGQYTIGLDFTGTSGGYATSVVFSAIGIANGETLFPGYVITVDEVLINGEPYELKGVPYTTSDDKICTRLNLYNNWVTAIPEEARTADGDVSNVTPNVLDADTLGNVETISVTFTYGPAK